MTAETGFKPRIYPIKSSSGKSEYMVTNYRPNRFSCSCRDYLYRSHDKNGYSTRHKCKHILSVIKDLKGGSHNVQP